jgi:hypothetical protein
MCLQCCVESVSYAEPIPGWFLQKAIKDHPDWSAGHYGLGTSNDPDFIIPFEPLKDLTFGMSDKELDKLEFDYNMAYEDQSEEFNKLLTCHPMTGYELVNACRSAGYNPEEDGYNIAYWLLHRLACSIEQGVIEE